MRMGPHIVCQLAFSILLTTVLCLGSVVNPSVANATVYYVATTGNDANPGGQSQPFRTVKKGMSVLQPGDTLYIRQGTYPEAIRTSTTGVPSGTSWSNAVTVAGYPNEMVTLTGDGTVGIDLSSGSGVSYVIFKDFTLDVSSNPNAPGTYTGTGVHHIRFENMEVRNTFSGIGTTSFGGVAFGGAANFIEVLRSNIHGFQMYGFYIKGQNWLIDGNQIHHNAGYGIQIYSSGQNNVSDNVIRNNQIYSNGGAFEVFTCGIALTSGSNNIAYNNIVRGHAGCGIQIDYTRGGTNNQVYNNTIYGNNGDGIVTGSGAMNTVVRNNVVYGNTTGDIHDFGSTGTVLSNNLTTDPQFVNASANDFTLQASSPAINAGVTVSIVTIDMKGVARPQGTAYDIGAYEYSQGTPPLPAPNNLRAVVQ